MNLRPYQSDSIESIYAYLRANPGNPLAVIPTGGGKTPVIGTICRDAVSTWGGRVIVLAHVKELLEQAAEKIRMIDPTLPIGVYSAGLKSRDLNYAVTVAGIQSIHKKASRLGKIDLAIIDEAHLIPFEGDGMYRNFIQEAMIVNPHLRVVGLTATPYRMKGGSIAGEGRLFNEICYEVGVKELIADGYLSKLKTKAGRATADLSGVHTLAGEFVANELRNAVDTNEIVRDAVAEIVEYTKDRKAVLIFAAGDAHGRHIQNELKESHGIHSEFVTGKTPSGVRDEIANRFKDGNLKYLININVFTTGFDAPIIDAVAMLRPTQSPGLYYQMVGRGFRLNPGKEDCLILDFGGNVLRHGPVDAIKPKNPGAKSGGGGDAPAKECPECHEVFAAGFSICPECGYVFPPPTKSNHESTASSEGIISGEKTQEVRRVTDQIIYAVHTKRGAAPDAPRTMRVEYPIGFNEYVSEWVCVEHEHGFAARKASEWWRKRSRDTQPTSADIAVVMANEGCLAEPTEITIERTAGDRFPQIVGCQLGDIPEPSHKWAVAAANQLLGIDLDRQPEVYAENSYLNDFDLGDIPF